LSGVNSHSKIFVLKNPDALDWEAATDGLPFACHQIALLVLNGPSDVAIERLLDHLDERGRGTHAGEETHLRRAITSYVDEDDVGAYGGALHSARIGSRGLFVGIDGFGEGDRSLTLREALQQARALRRA
jgi:hypothetical protein